MKHLRILLIVLSAVFMIGSAIGGTAAWLGATTKPVVNTFTYGDINIELEETPTVPTDPDSPVDPDAPVQNEYKMIPGDPIAKDPKVTVLADSEECWLFVKLDKSEGFDTYFEEIELADGWNKLLDEDGNIMTGIYWQIVAASEEDQVIQVLSPLKDENHQLYEQCKDGHVQVKLDVTKEQLTAIGTNYPTLTVTAYAVQYANVESAIAAWNCVPNNP